MPRRFDAAVVGAGPGGYVAAIRLGQLGKKTVLIEKDKLGGECLNYGCIPSKALINVGNLMAKVRRAEAWGLHADGLRLDMPALQRWKQGVVDTLQRGIGKLCASNHVEVVQGEAHFRDARHLDVRTAAGNEEIEADAMIIATGSRPIELPGFPFDRKTILSSKEVLELETVPPRLLVVGGGITGLEMGMFYAKVGSKVTVVELLDTLLPGVEKEIVRVVARSVEKAGIAVHTGSKVLSWAAQDGVARAAVETPTGPQTVEAEKILVTVGRRPNTAGINLEGIGVALDGKGFVKVDDRLRTNVPGVYAIGDVVGQPFLAHKASKEGIVAAEVIAGQPAAVDYKALPNAIFTDPEVATVGMSEDDARQKGHEVVVGRFPFSALGRAQGMGETEGFVKVVGDAKTKLLLGMAAVGPEASEIISEAALAIEMGATLEDIGYTIHPHPTLPEAVMEAAEAALGRAIHVVNR